MIEIAQEVRGQTLGSVTTFLGRNHIISFESLMYLKSFSRGAPLLRPVKNFYGPKTDVIDKTVEAKNG